MLRVHLARIQSFPIGKYLQEAKDGLGLCRCPGIGRSRITLHMNASHPEIRNRGGCEVCVAATRSGHQYFRPRSPCDASTVLVLPVPAVLLTTDTTGPQAPVPRIPHMHVLSQPRK